MTEHHSGALIIDGEVYDLIYFTKEEGCIVAVAIDDQGTNAQEELEHTVEAIKLALGHVSVSESQ